MFKQLSDGRFTGDGLDKVARKPFEVIAYAFMAILGNLPMYGRKPAERRAARRAAKQEYKRRYRTEHRDKYLEQKRADSRNRRAAVRMAAGSISPSQWRELCEKYGNRCLRCRTAGKMTLDHVLPLALGGSNTIDNAQPLCSRCNTDKGARHIDYR